MLLCRMLSLGIISKFAGGIGKLDSFELYHFLRRCTLAGTRFFMKIEILMKNVPKLLFKLLISFRTFPDFMKLKINF